MQRRAFSGEGVCTKGSVLNNNSKTDLALKWFGLRLVSPAANKEYGVWRVGTAIPFIRIGLIASILSWVSMPISLYFASPELVDQVLPVTFLLVLPIIFINLAATFIQKARFAVFPLTVITVAVGGSLLIWLMHDVFVYPGANTPYVTAAALTSTFFAFTIYRLPLRLALLAITPVIGTTLFFTLGDFNLQQINSLELGAALNYTFIGLFSGMLICTILDSVTLRNYIHLRTIGTQQNLIRRYIPHTVAEKILGGEEASINVPKRQLVTVLFSDIVRFTNMADRLDPEVVTRVISEYMTAMTDIVEAHQGTVNEFIGDGIMAMFGAPQALDAAEQARMAILSAQAMQEQLPQLNNQWRKLGLDEDLIIRIGIKTGDASVGSFGSGGRLTYTAIGHQVNIAARIQSHCEPGSILISDATYQLVDDVIDCEAKGEVECKGVHFPVKVYAPAVTFET